MRGLPCSRAPRRRGLPGARELLIRVAVAIPAVVWWGALLRLLIRPEDSGPLVSAVATAGWSLGVIPVHCTLKRRPLRRRGARGGNGAQAGAAVAEAGGDIVGAGRAGRAGAVALEVEGAGSGHGRPPGHRRWCRL
ncbi:hypothetical protein GCM10012280_39760 [Wenjunlia tyrosinilytica]|uniref:Uncharacterized protein n=1 Tax=Wenjunlia tyrosinilytica TaxID=1544741 RepID=A0A918DZZ2_9ACTN|nr:hypothetical protein GCM10012280_39760 [Wenjunlia tyrosinilytica]